jgi:hypothetical protein
MLSIKLNRSVLPLAFSFALAVMVLAAAGSAFAFAGAESSSAINLNTLNISLESGMSMNPPLQSFESTGYSVSPTDYQFGSETSLKDSAYNFAATTALADSSTINQLSIVSAGGLGAYYATAQSLIDGFFAVSGNGYITITADYDLFLQVFTDWASESASGMSRASLYFFNSTTYVDDSDVQQLIPAVPGNYFNAQNGQLTATLFFNDGDTGSFRLIVEGEAAASSVPEPSMFALLGIGIFGGALLRKRIKR